MIRNRFLANQRGTAAAEFALTLPMLLVLMFVGMEGGNFIWTQHKLVDAVRDGARFAGRSQVSQLCNGAASVISTAKVNEIKLLTRTGQITDTAARAKVRGWTAAQVTVTVSCRAFVNTGIYTTLGENGAIVTVAATNVTYPSMFQRMGVLKSTINLNAKSNAPVIGI